MLVSFVSWNSLGTLVKRTFDEVVIALVNVRSELVLGHSCLATSVVHEQTVPSWPLITHFFVNLYNNIT